MIPEKSGKVNISILSMSDDSFPLLFRLCRNSGEKQAVPHGGSLYIVLPPPPLGHSQIVRNLQNVDKKPRKKGGLRGYPPWAASPLGERGGHSHSCRREYANDKKKRFFNKAIISSIVSRWNFQSPFIRPRKYPSPVASRTGTVYLSGWVR